jgi:hypothetical protein
MVRWQRSMKHLNTTCRLKINTAEQAVNIQQIVHNYMSILGDIELKQKQFRPTVQGLWDTRSS